MFVVMTASAVGLWWIRPAPPDVAIRPVDFRGRSVSWSDSWDLFDGDTLAFDFGPVSHVAVFEVVNRESRSVWFREIYGRPVGKIRFDGRGTIESSFTVRFVDRFIDRSAGENELMPGGRMLVGIDAVPLDGRIQIGIEFSTNEENSIGRRASREMELVEPVRVWSTALVVSDFVPMVDGEIRRPVVSVVPIGMRKLSTEDANEAAGIRLMRGGKTVEFEVRNHGPGDTFCQTHWGRVAYSVQYLRKGEWHDGWEPFSATDTNYDPLADGDEQRFVVPIGWNWEAVKAGVPITMEPWSGASETIWSEAYYVSKADAGGGGG